MLRAGDEDSAPARACAIEMVHNAGLQDYGEVALGEDLRGGESTATGLTSAVRALAMQLTAPAHEWFLADVVRVGLADGQLSDAERCAAREIAALLGMSAAQARDVISMTEEGAAAG